MPVTVILGAQWGDEGKGKLVDILASSASLCARCQGGSNAGHTIVTPNGTKYDFHLIPSGLVHPRVLGLIGSGVVVHLGSLFKEIDVLRAKGLECEARLKVSSRAHLVFDLHRVVDGLKERELGVNGIGTTKQGIGPAYSTKASRSGLRVHHLYDSDFEALFRRLYDGRRKRYGAAIESEYDVEKELAELRAFAERLRPMVVDNTVFLHRAIHSANGDGASPEVLIEGANAVLLDLDFGTYPYVTSSNTTIGGVLTGLGLPPRAISKTIGVVKAYTTRVGGGPFPTELAGDDQVGSRLQTVGHEYGTTTGRPRRCGWLDLVAVQHGAMINGYDVINLTKLDVLTGIPELKVAVGYVTADGGVIDGFPADLGVLGRLQVVYETLPGWDEDISTCRTWDALPANAKKYVAFVEAFLKCKVEWIGVGPERDATIHMV